MKKATLTKIGIIVSLIIWISVSAYVMYLNDQL